MVKLQNKRFLFFVLLISSFNLQAQKNPDNSFLWRLDPASGNKVYLVGTFPMDNTDLIDIPKTIQRAFDNVELIVFDRSPLDLNAEYQRLFVEKGFYPADEMTSEHLDANLYQQLEKRLEELKSPLGHMPRMKPWLITISLLNLETEETGYARMGLKEYYFNQATEEEKEIVLLDKVLSEQSLLSDLSEEAQIEYLQHCLKNSKNNIRQNSNLFEAWRKGNFIRFCTLVEKQQQKSPLAIQEIQTKIQESLPIDQLVEIINSEKSAIIFVDATRLVGKNGLLDKLEAEGVEISEL